MSFENFALSAAVVVSFFVCWAPFHTQRLLHVFIYSYKSVKAQLIAQLDDLCIVLWLSVLIIYISKSRSQMKYSAAVYQSSHGLLMHSWSIEIDLAPLFYVTGVLLYLRLESFNQFIYELFSFLCTFTIYSTFHFRNIIMNYSAHHYYK